MLFINLPKSPSSSSVFLILLHFGAALSQVPAAMHISNEWLFIVTVFSSVVAGIIGMDSENQRAAFVLLGRLWSKASSYTPIFVNDYFLSR